MNSVIISGNIGKIDFDHTKSGKAKLYFSLARNSRGRGGEEGVTQWYNIIAWGESAEYLSSRLKVGAKVVVSGRLNQYTNNDGNTTTQIVAREVYVIAKYNSDNNQGGADQPSGDGPRTNQPSSDEYLPPDWKREQQPKRLRVEDDDGELDPWADDEKTIFNV